MGARRKARELALQMLFENDVAGTLADEMFRRSADLQKAPAALRDFTERLVSGTLEHRDDLDAIISKQADHWRLSRMPIVDRNILRLAIYEMSRQETPPAVVIDEALELARQFSGERSVSFINGVLDAVHKEN